MAKPIDTGAFTAQMRAKIVRPASGEILISRLAGSDQQADLTVPPNCDGLGRVRHFRRATAAGWPQNPLPIDPAARALGGVPGDMVRAQVFQNAACGWRCWYCFVPFAMLNGNAANGVWRTAEQLVSLYATEADRPDVIDLSGGSPDLTPEWIVWMMDALEEAGLAETTYLWSDDNLSTDYVFTKLSDAQRERLAAYRNYGRVCCFKGFDAASFAFNTTAQADGYDAQFERFGQYLELGLDLYGYVTLTGPGVAAAANGVPALLDRLQRLDPNLPLRVIPLEIGNFSPTRERDARGGHARFEAAAPVQDAAIAIWMDELDRRYPADLRTRAIVDVPLGVQP
ncbi:MAG: hypothetical protein GC203_12695 [Phenylobacterium sp.]|uniref:hypothetical protein n=1 Tax=Phenylobacterium sp. TaxID=1871053 RepID=UPI0025DB1279|nr:hypothetical protein [Phenylobacterium sp.]MBI1198713.1 hypothetical protein [Phenylobacterium sp.]